MYISFKIATKTVNSAAIRVDFEKADMLFESVLLIAFVPAYQDNL